MNILVFGAGRSAYYTIAYLLEHGIEKGWEVAIADSSQENLDHLTQGFPNAMTYLADVHDEKQRQSLIGGQHLVISLLPARFHNLVAEDCVRFGVNLITPSYLTPEIQAMDAPVRKKGLIFLNELGLDPGIDHMSAMQIIEKLRKQSAKITSFKSYCGGVVARESDTNPWHYKISWNPYNIIRAGKDGGLAYINGHAKYIPYSRLFRETESFQINGDSFDGYLNRNSEQYVALYRLQQASTFVRGTLRYKGFCEAWNILVGLGMTNDNIQVGLAGKPWDEFIEMFLPDGKDLKHRIEAALGYSVSHEAVEAFAWLGDRIRIKPPVTATPAEALQVMLEEKWHMGGSDRDRVVMVHEFGYEKNGKKHRLQSWLDLEGENATQTAMAKTVGLPLALAAELIADKKIKSRGVLMPTLKEVYDPIMERLGDFGVRFEERVHSI
jgi:saccharopine dehydrogenase-like NADP-dependent oxidoreductase